MKVLYIVTAYPRWDGDIITPWMVETISRLRGRGIDVEVLAPAYRGMESGVWDGVRVHRFRYAPRRWETLTHDQTAPDRVRERPAYLALVPGYIAAGSIAAAKLARRERYDVVHAFWPIPHGLLGVAAKKAAGVPLVTTFFGVELTWASRQLRVAAPVVRRIARSSDAVTAISSYTAAELRRFAPDVEPRIIPFGAATDAGGAASPSARSAGEPMSLIFVGRLVERKGVRYLLEALVHGPDRLVIVGDGPERPLLEQQAQALGLGGRVEFTGPITQGELDRRLQASDALVLPAVRDRKGDVEGLGVVLIEALLAGRPVIASRSGGIVDIVIDGETGLLAEPGDAGSLANAITRYREDPELAKRLVTRGAAHVRERFGWDGIIDRLEGLYSELAHPARD